MGCTDVEALVYWNLAPLEARRDMAMLGLIHRTVLGEGPAHFQRFFKVSETGTGHWTRLGKRKHEHDRQLVQAHFTKCPELQRRSALGLVAVYNLLPKQVVSQKTVKDFQGELQNVLVERATAGCENWALTFSPRLPWWSHPLR